MSKNPNPAHISIAECEARLSKQGRSVVVITQNIDELHKKAGTKHLLEIHGKNPQKYLSSICFIYLCILGTAKNLHKQRLIMIWQPFITRRFLFLCQFYLKAHKSRTCITLFLGLGAKCHARCERDVIGPAFSFP